MAVAVHKKKKDQKVDEDGKLVVVGVISIMALVPIMNTLCLRERDVLKLFWVEQNGVSCALLWIEGCECVVSNKAGSILGFTVHMIKKGIRIFFMPGVNICFCDTTSKR
ncbi:hypothetical protein BCR42DRAFT_398539 [Absidia repens]|uniref:Uncharacterized protein n=1 Tax=Absidia repens TaxID=90262 RepID=A0A1X2HXK4_9FUNG|nr:hypothetical protein BCR42DRAFT_398539 [Absidia repens]